jgi:hypothetical protein
MATGKNSKAVTLDDVREEFRIANRLMIAQLALGGMQAKDIAAVVGRDESAISRMFPKGLLRRLGNPER